ncbi:MAG: hypothetical protein PW788_10300 [Micavibrio sp.]|nr:hypothetical protein [Micavibrio sp.]
MSLSESFNNDYAATKLNSAMLQVQYSSTGGNAYLVYDFNARLLVSRTGAGEGGVTLLPFSQLDPDSLEALRNRLIELGGKPPALPSVDVPLPKPRSNQLNP